MKSIKRLSLLVALILCVTVGGVYAVWSYSAEDVLDQTQLTGAVMADAESVGSYGTYHIDQTTNNVKLEIDQKAAGNYTPVLNITGSITITFIPNANVPKEITDNGYIAYITFTNPDGANMYLGDNIFTLTTDPITVNPLSADSGEKWTKGDDGKFRYELTAEKLTELIKINDAANFYLDTKAEYDAFNGVLTGVNLHVGDGKTTVASLT